MTKYEVSKEILVAHEKVIEKAMQDYAALPMRAFTVAGNAEEVCSFLRKNYTALKGLLKDMDNKMELGVKAYWKDMKAKKDKEGEELTRSLKRVKFNYVGPAPPYGFARLMIR